VVKKESMGVMKGVFASIVRWRYILAHLVGRGIKNAIFLEDSILDKSTNPIDQRAQKKKVISM